jgi:hypothetical protein
MIRSVLAVLAGLVGFSIALLAMDSAATPLMNAIYPDRPAVASVIELSNVTRVLWLLWETASLTVAGYITAWLAPRFEVRHAVVLGALQALMTVWAMFAIRDQSLPMWFWLAGILLMVPAAWLGGRIRVKGEKARPAVAI